MAAVGLITAGEDPHMAIRTPKRGSQQRLSERDMHQVVNCNREDRVDERSSPTPPLPPSGEESERVTGATRAYILRVKTVTGPTA